MADRYDCTAEKLDTDLAALFKVLVSDFRSVRSTLGVPGTRDLPLTTAVGGEGDLSGILILVKHGPLLLLRLFDLLLLRLREEESGFSLGEKRLISVLMAKSLLAAGFFAIDLTV